VSVPSQQLNPSVYRKLSKWDKLLQEYQEVPSQEEIQDPSYSARTVPWTGLGNTRLGLHIRGIGPPFQHPPPPFPKQTNTYPCSWNQNLGLYNWTHNQTGRVLLHPPANVLLLTRFTEEDLSLFKPTPPESEKEDTETSSSDTSSEEEQEPEPIVVEQVNPLISATTPRNEPLPTFRTPDTPLQVFPLLTRQATPPRDSPETPPQVLPTQVIPVHLFTGLPPALSNVPILPTSIINNIFGFANLQLVNNTPPVNMAVNPPVTLNDLTTQINKLKGGSLNFSGSGDPVGFTNWMNLLIRTKNIMDNDDKLREWLGHLSGQALTWSAPYFDDIFNTTANYVRKYTLQDFLDAFKRTYTFQNLQESARNRLKYLKQGNKTVGNYVQQFQSLIHHAGYGIPETLQRFLSGLNPKL